MDNTYMYGEEVAKAMTSPVETVTIPRALYESLLEDAAWLRSLEDAGVDNWSGIAFAYELHNEED
jgi:hypothetical protein